MSPRNRRLLIILILAFVTALPLRQALLGGGTIGPFDQIRQMAPWNGAKPAQPWDVIQADGVLQFYGWRDLVLESWSHGKIPVWNPYELAGYPLLANSQSGALYPPHILLGLLHVATPWAIVLLAWFHLFWAGLGVYWLSRRLGADQLGGVVAATGFPLSTFMLSWTALGSVIATVSWIPWALGAVLSPPSRKTFALAAGSVGMMFLAGHLQFAAYGAMAIVLAGLFTKSPKGVLVAFAALGVGAMIALPQLKPVLDYGQYSHRKNKPSEEGYKAYLAGAIQPFELANLTNPTNLGDPRNPAVDIGNGRNLSSYWAPLAKQGATFADDAITVGPLVLALLVFVPWRRKESAALGAIGALGFLIALGTAINWPLYFLVPSWSSTGSPSRAGVLFILALNVLAGVGFTHASGSNRKQWSLAAGLGAGLALVCGFVFPSLAPATSGPIAQALTAVQQVASAEATATAMASLLISVLILFVWISPKTAPYRKWAACGPVILFLTSTLALRGIVPVGQPLAKVVGVAPHERIAVVNNGWDLLTAAPALLPPNTASQSRIHELGGYDSLLHRDTVALLGEVNGQDPAPHANGNMMFIKPTVNLKALREAGVSEVWTQKPIPSLSIAAREDHGVMKYRLDGPGRLSATTGHPEVSSEDLSSITVLLNGASGELVVRDASAQSFVDGWSAATESGQQLAMKLGRWLKVDVPPDAKEIIFRYTPPGFGWTPWVALLAALLLLGLAFFPTTSRKATKIEAEAS